MTSIKYDYNFLAGYFDNDKLIFNNYNLLLHLYITDADTNYQLAFERMDYIIYEIIDNGIFVHENDTKNIEKLKTVNCNYITISDPGPIDQMIQITLTTKLNAVTTDMVNILESELNSLRGGQVQYLYYMSEDDVDEKINMQDPQKWWNDSSPRCSPLDETTDICNFKDNITWSVIEHEITSEEETQNITNKSCNIISMVIPNDETR